MMALAHAAAGWNGAGSGGGVEVEEKVKLVVVPRGMGVLLAEMWRFEEERGCRVVEIRGRGRECLVVERWIAMAGRRECLVRVDGEVREGHVVLVGG